MHFIDDSSTSHSLTDLLQIHNTMIFAFTASFKLQEQTLKYLTHTHVQTSVQGKHFENYG
jgi:hypothetical protein